MKKNTPKVAKSESVRLYLRRPQKKMINRGQRRTIRRLLQHGQEALE